MALIYCSECGLQVSDKAQACIHCGCPMNIANAKRAQTIDIQELIAEYKLKYPSCTDSDIEGYLADVLEDDCGIDFMDAYPMAEKAVNNVNFHYALTRTSNKLTNILYLDELVSMKNNDLSVVKSVLIKEYNYNESYASAIIESEKMGLYKTERCQIEKQKGADDLISCNVCSKQISPNAPACPHCGEPLAKRCPKCKSSNIKRIGGFQKGISAELFGAYATNTILNDYQCLACGEKFK